MEETGGEDEGWRKQPLGWREEVWRICPHRGRHGVDFMGSDEDGGCVRDLLTFTGRRVSFRVSSDSPVLLCSPSGRQHVLHLHHCLPVRGPRHLRRRRAHLADGGRLVRLYSSLCELHNLEAG